MAFNTNFSIRRFKEIIESLNLNLRNTNVLTEAATGAYSTTAVIAAHAGANVEIFAADTKHGSAEKAYLEVFNLAELLGCKSNIKLFDITNKNPRFDIITNSGHLRPLDSTKLSLLKTGGIVPLMYEDWELRESDINLNYCKKNNIPVVATNERHPDIDVFGFLGNMAVKQMMDFKLPIYQSNILLFCNNDFGPYIAKFIAPICKKLFIIGKNIHGYKTINNTIWIGNFTDFNLVEIKENIDGIIYTASPFTKTFLGNSTRKIDAKIFKEKFDDTVVFRFCGDIDADYFNKIKLSYFPAAVKSGHMGVLPSDIGYEPIIRLQSGSLKAAELLLKGKTNYKGKPLAIPLFR